MISFVWERHEEAKVAKTANCRDCSRYSEEQGFHNSGFRKGASIYDIHIILRFFEHFPLCPPNISTVSLYILGIFMSGLRASLISTSLRHDLRDEGGAVFNFC